MQLTVLQLYSTWLSGYLYKLTGNTQVFSLQQETDNGGPDQYSATPTPAYTEATRATEDLDTTATEKSSQTK